MTKDKYLPPNGYYDSLKPLIALKSFINDAESKPAHIGRKYHRSNNTICLNEP